MFSAYPDSLLDALALRSYAHDAGAGHAKCFAGSLALYAMMRRGTPVHVTVMASPVCYVHACHTLNCTCVTYKCILDMCPPFPWSVAARNRQWHRDPCSSCTQQLDLLQMLPHCILPFHRLQGPSTLFARLQQCPEEVICFRAHACCYTEACTPAALQKASPEHVHDSGAPDHAANGLHVHIQVAVLGLDGQLLAEPAQSPPNSARQMPHHTSVQQCQAVQHAVTLLNLAR